MTGNSVLRPTLQEAATAWQALVWAASEQSARLAALPGAEGEAFWAARAPRFRPGTSESEELPYLLSLAREDDDWLDIGAGAGRLAIPLSRVVRRVIALDTSEVMRAGLVEAAREAGTQVDVLAVRWPEDSDGLPTVGVTLAANMLYSITEPLPFIEAMERHARRICVVALADRLPRAPDPAIWEALHGEPLATLPGATEFATFLGAAGRRFDLATFPAPAAQTPAVDAVVAQGWRYGLTQDSPLMGRLREIATSRLAAGEPLRTGRSFTAVFSWAPSI